MLLWLAQQGTSVAMSERWAQAIRYVHEQVFLHRDNLTKLHEQAIHFALRLHVIRALSPDQLERSLHLPGDGACPGRH